MPDEAPEQHPLPEPSLCLNCGNLLVGAYCSNCGQQDKSVKRMLPSLLAEAFGGLFAFNSRTYRTLWYLLTKPAFLSNEYLSGKRASYLPPLRLFLVSIVIFIFSLSIDIFLGSVSAPSDSPQLSGDDVEITELEVVPDPANAEPVANQNPLSAQINDEEYNSLQEFIAQLNFPFLGEEMNQRFVGLLQDRTENRLSGILQDPGSFFADLLDYVPIMMLVLVPVLAFIQQIVYVGSRRYYIEHLVLTIHNHSFLFIAFITLFLTDAIATLNSGFLTAVTGTVSAVIQIWIVIYLFLSLKNFFQQGYFFTTLKFLLTSIAYGCCLLFAIVLLIIFGFLTY